ncbi:hypothetical protein GE09DRAFT_46399 [Coniochaeta sp. 2T2.1]|nr:hypothetical protein GE09DRAFT_46399 [Coniochaeta sp. 2T2.1]
MIVFCRSVPSVVLLVVGLVNHSCFYLYLVCPATSRRAVLSCASTPACWHRAVISAVVRFILSRIGSTNSIEDGLLRLWRAYCPLTVRTAACYGRLTGASHCASSYGISGPM